MHDIDSERVRKEAAAAVASKPPAAIDERVEAAMRRYLGASEFEMLRHEKEAVDPDAPGGAASDRPDRG